MSGEARSEGDCDAGGQSQCGSGGERSRDAEQDGNKWNTTHTGSIDTASLLKFIQGLKDLLNSRKDKFSGKLYRGGMRLKLRLIRPGMSSS